MELTEHRCSRCGAALTQQSDTRWKCRYCGCTYDDTTATENTKKMRELFDEVKLELVNNLRRNLYDATTAEYISSADVKHICMELKKFLPDDFSANFYEIAVGNNVKRLTAAIRNIDVEAHLDEVDTIIKFLIKSLQPDFLLELNNLAERAYKPRNLKKFEQVATEISVQAEKVQMGVYETKLPREVFVAYSSRDMEKVSELVEELESQGLKCFVAARNLRHGKGAVEDYDRALKEAMDHCRSFVFVSTQNSRSFGCDALKIELPYIQEKDTQNAPAEYRNDYAAIPHRYKKPRVEYRVEESQRPNAADTIVREFFDGYEWVLSPAEVAVRVLKQIIRAEDEEISFSAIQQQKKQLPVQELMKPEQKTRRDNVRWSKGKQMRMVAASALLSTFAFISLSLAFIGVLVSTAEGFDRIDIEMIVFFAVVGGVFLYPAIRTKKKVKRIKRYISVVVDGNVTQLDAIASALGDPCEIVKKNLQTMISKGYLKSVYINEKTRELVWHGNISAS